MSLIDLTNPNNAADDGGLSNPDPIVWTSVQHGVFFDLILDSFTSSDDVDKLFNLASPPSFTGPFMVTCQLDNQNGTLHMFLATSTGDTSFPFADLDGFDQAISSSGPSSGNGTGTLFRDNKLPPSINWTLNP